jgi:steroid delta-isomerase-like uncharacterized protein
MTDSKELVRRFANSLNSHNVDDFDELFAPDYILHDPGTPGGILQGLEDIKDHTAMLYRGMPDFYTTIEELIAEDDRVVGRFTHRGTHLEEMLGMPPTGNKVEVEAINIYKIADGKFVEGWGEIDTITLLQQLGLMGGAGGAAQ